ncbi:hypothetical protein K502DRAFT_359571 [Neoconidiobolus thromboides FSU 785]|nr:hypothetical protein K502DRAFT_359571 [Neoconidiobolus thromboides FSU 785]
MELKLEYLPLVVLDEIFKLVSPKELFKLRFLNKYLFNTINDTIKYNLTYSIYSHYEIKEYNKCQEDFIKKNGLMMRHLSINDNNVEYLNYCPNILTLSYSNNIRKFNNSIVDKSNNKMDVNLVKLRKIIINTSSNDDCCQLFEQFKASLYQLEMIEINSYCGDLENIIKYLNPNKLKIFKLYSDDYLNINGLATIKTKFYNLKVLHLKFNRHIITPKEYRYNINFSSNLELIVEGDFYLNFNINCLGSLSNLKSVKLIDTSGSLFNADSNDIKSIESGNIISLGYLDIVNSIKYHLVNLPTLREVYFNELTMEKLKLISMLSNIEVIHINYLNFDSKSIIQIPSSSSSDNRKTESRLYKCNFIKQITIDFYHPSYEQFISFLLLFPKLNAVKINNFDLIAKHKTIDFKLNTPLLLTTPAISYTNISAFNELANTPMLNWIRI